MEAVVSAGTLHQCSVSLVVEGLLAHYFSIDQPKYYLEDARWFFELVNKEERWFSEEDVSLSKQPALVEFDASEENGEDISLKAQVQVSPGTCTL